MESKASGRARIPLHTKILIGLVFGAAAGITSNALWREAPALGWVVQNVATPVGQVFLRMLFMLVVPLVFTSLALGVAGLGDVRKVGRVGAKTLGFFLLTTTLAAVIGLILVNTVRPGDTLEPAVRAQLLETYATQAAERVGAAETSGFGISTFVNIVPRNPLDAAAGGDMLGLIFFTLVFGMALTLLREEVAAPVIRVLHGVAEAVAVMIGFAMRIAPVGVAGLIFSVTARFGFDIVKSLGLYVVVVLSALIIHQFGSIGTLVRTLGGIRIGSFFRRSEALMITALSTSSSAATLPTTIRTAEQEFGVPSKVAGFVLPLGATMNMNGTAIFESITVLFLAQVFGVHLGLPAQVIVIVLTVLTAIGAAGVPSGSIPLLVLVLQTVGVPGEGIALILGVDRLLDMCRTVPNVTGDLLTSIVIARSEGFELAADGPRVEETAETIAIPGASPVAAASGADNPGPHGAGGRGPAA
ncbi:MAG: dicarboxylate/amino acid:cation symporter [Gemmatimonadetes bacterium]|nr:dicarboxylate/amino acid:cation symporter [Gemmatimonadota bacterium]